MYSPYKQKCVIVTKPISFLPCARAHKLLINENGKCSKILQLFCPICQSKNFSDMPYY